MNSGLVFLLTAAPESHEPQLIDLDATAFVQLGVFLLLVLVLGRLLWRPYLRVREERVTRVDGYREQASTLEAEATERLARADAEIAEARRLGNAVRAAARTEALAREQALLADAHAEAQRTLGAARVELDAALVKTRADLGREAGLVARAAANKIIGREVAT
jgi:F-type H+-transporting ATPase subunit b